MVTMKVFVVLGAAVAGSLGWMGEAAAQESSSESALSASNAEPTAFHAHDERGAWYGWQTMLAGFSGIGLMVAAYGTDKETAGNLVATGLIVYMAGPPLVHVAHGRSTAAGLSFAAGTGIPVITLGVAIGYCLGRGEGDDFCDNIDKVLIAEMSLITLVNGAFFSFEPADAPAKAARPFKSPVEPSRGARVQPTMFASDKSLHVGLFGIW
jgi:hypothetical protein